MWHWIVRIHWPYEVLLRTRGERSRDDQITSPSYQSKGGPLGISQKCLRRRLWLKAGDEGVKCGGRGRWGMVWDKGEREGFRQGRGSNNVPPVAKRGTKRGLINGRRRRRLRAMGPVSKGSEATAKLSVWNSRGLCPLAESIEGEVENGRPQTPGHYWQFGSLLLIL